MLLPHTFKVELCSLLLMVLFQPTILFSQINNTYPSYAIGQNELSEDVFYEYDLSSNEWIEISKGTAGNITAITSDPVTKQMFASKGQNFGTINPANGEFVALSNFDKTVYGKLGTLSISSIDAMCYDVTKQVIYAVHRIEDQSDILLQINPQTGNIIERNFISKADNEEVDYQVIQELDLAGKIYDVAADIAIHPLSGQLYVIYKHSEEFCLVVSNKLEGSIVAPLFEISDKAIRNFEFSSNGKLYAIAEDISTSESNVYHIDHFTGKINPVSGIADNTNIEFTAVEFLKPYNDIALTIEQSSTMLPLSPGDDVNFEIEIFNQGEVEVNFVEIINYLPPGLKIKNETEWQQTNHSYSLLEINQAILPNQSTKRQLQFTVSETYTTGTIANFVEISAYVNTYNENGQPSVWPDIDSEADSENNEVIYIDNEINENGALKSEDEDDHDFVTVNVNSSCIPQLSFRNMDIASALYHAGDHIYTDNAKVETGTILKAGNAVIMNKGFEVATNVDFEAKIGSCK